MRVPTRQQGQGQAGRGAIAEDERFQRREWAAERAGWALMGMVVLAGLLGLLGNGPLSAATERDPSGRLALSYQRFARNLGRTTLALQLAPEAAAAGVARVRFSQAYLRAVQVESVTPEPSSVSVEGGEVVYEFALPPAGQPVGVRMDLRPDRIGLQRGTVGLEGAEPLRFWQFTYP